MEDVSVLALICVGSRVPSFVSITAEGAPWCGGSVGSVVGERAEIDQMAAERRNIVQKYKKIYKALRMLLLFSVAVCSR